jgi:hypothetical protein
MEALRDIAGATTVAFLMVAVFKAIYQSASSKMIGSFAVAAGQFAAVAMTGMRGELHFTQITVFSIIVTGIFATASAMGIRYFDGKADANRTGESSTKDSEI